MAKKTQMVEVELNTDDGKNQATVMVAFQSKNGKCDGTIVSIAAKKPNSELGWAWKIGLGVSKEISMLPGLVLGDCVKGICVYTISASWTVRSKLTIGFQFYDRSKTFIGKGIFSSGCHCEE